MSTPLKPKTKQDAFLAKAKALLADNNNDAAMRNFKQACIYCDCHRALLRDLRAVASNISIADLPLPACHCRDILSLDPNDGDKQAIYRLATKPCTCGSGVKSCDSQAHLDALNGMAVICGRRKAYKDALKYASLLILVAPLMPTGYLRLAKSLRLQDASQGTDTRKQWTWIYSQLKTTGADSAKLKGLANVLRVDIISRSPPEIQETILKQLTYRDLCRCMRVSKAWNYASRNAGLWRHLKFSKGLHTTRVRPFPKGVLNDIISRRSRNLAQSLWFSGIRDFDIDDTKLSSLLKGLPHLKSLILFDTAPLTTSRHRNKPTSLSGDDRRFSLENILQALCRDASNGLEFLLLGDFSCSGDRQGSIPVMSATVNFATSLRELKLFDLEHPGLVVHMMLSTQWPSLEKLNIYNSRKLSVPLEALVLVTPSLKDLTLHCVTTTIPQDCPHTWEKLERLSLAEVSPHGSFRPFKSSALRSLELWDAGMENILAMMAPSSDDTPDTALDKLEHFRCHGDGLHHATSDAERLDALKAIKPSCVNGTLQSLVIDFLPHLYDQVINKTVIHTLSCHEMKTPSIHPGGYSGQTDEFLEWLDEFPNLTTLGVFPAKADNAWLTVAKLVRKLDEKSLVKTIYTDALYGTYRDEVLKSAAKKDIRIIDAGRVPELPLQPLPLCPKPKRHRNTT